MEIFVTAFSALPGKEAEVSEFYAELQPEYEAAKGFQGRQVLRAQTGRMAEALLKVMTPEQMAQHPEPDMDGSTHFVIIEKWDSIEDRMAFSATQDKSRNARLFLNQLPRFLHKSPARTDEIQRHQSHLHVPLHQHQGSRKQIIMYRF